MNESLISILMPVKNAALFLPECIESILAQSESNWELIAINDHSDDESYKILESYAANDLRIKYINNSGHGIIDALRTAYLTSGGTLIHRMDADDKMHNEKLQILKTNLLKNGKGHVAIGGVEYFSQNELGTGYQKYANWLNELTKLGSNYLEIYKECVIPSPCWMVYRADFEQAGAFNNDRYPEDYDLCFRFYQSGLKCIPCDSNIHLWRDHSLRSSRTQEHYRDNRFLDIKLDYFLELHFDTSRQLCIWGAGDKGKSIAKILIDKGVSFRWICNNERKIGHNIYGITLASDVEISQFYPAQFIVVIANPNEQAIIGQRLKQHKLKPLEDFFFFC